MADAGRPRTPTKLKKLKGTFQKSRSVKNEMQVEPWESDAPPHKLEGYALAEWNRLLPQLKLSGVVGKIDQSSLFALCNEWGKYMDAEELLKKNGRVVKSPNGYPMIHPYEIISAQSFKRYKEMATQFGVTPASRSKVGSSGESAPAQDPYEAAVSGQAKMKVSKKSA